MSNKNENQNKQETLANTTTSQTAATTTTVGTGAVISNSSMQYGWVCPRCGKVNAPWKDSCNCYLNIPYTPPNTPAPTPFNPTPSWPQTPEIGDAPGWWQYGPNCGEPIPCGGSIGSDDATPKPQIYNIASKITSGPIYKASQDSPIYVNNRPQTCRAKTCNTCDLLNYPELCGIERMARSSKIDSLINSVNGLKDSIDKKLGG